MSQITIIKKNDEFQSFDECFMKVELHCKESFVNFYIHDSHRFGIKDEKKEPHIWKNKILKCVHAGDPNNIKTTSTGIRSTQHYHATNCPWFIRIVYQPKHNNYIIKDCILHHNLVNEQQSCNDFLDTLLPCKHAFFSRNFFKVDLFVNDLVCNRWRKKRLTTNFIPNLKDNTVDTIKLCDIRNINLMANRVIINDSVMFFYYLLN